jgi:pheromone shutdown-related protein TraB
MSEGSVAGGEAKAGSNVTRVVSGGRDFAILGTAHVSRESAEEAAALIEAERPDRVCVEIDESRYKAMSDPDAWKRQDVVKVIREGKGFLLLANLALSSFQRRLGADTGMKPGAEMLAAIEAANRVGASVSFVDRDVQVTLRRAWGRGGLWKKANMLATLLSSALGGEKPTPDEIEKLKDKNELGGLMDELASEMPEVKEVLIDERDRYLAAKILAAEGKKVVAVVGAGHVPGIAKAIESGAAAEDVTPLEKVPSPGIAGKVVGWLIPLSIVGLIAWGFFKSGTDLSLSLLVQWLLWNGSLAALGSLLCLAHPLSILVSFVGAPIATLNPVLGVGMFAGVVEAMVRKPSVSDFERLGSDIASVKGFYTNRVTKALLVFLLSSIGGAIGNFIAFPTMFAKLLG